MTACAAHTSPALGRVVSSAQSFRSYFRDLGHAGTTVNPLERFVFSLVLANPKGNTEAHIHEAPRAREVQNRGPVVEHHT